jgi:hypothetical protein
LIWRKRRVPLLDYSGLSCMLLRRPSCHTATQTPLNRKTGSHAALYLSQDRGGIWVIEQYRNIKEGLISKRYIPFRGGKGSPSNDGDTYSVIE